MVVGDWSIFLPDGGNSQPPTPQKNPCQVVSIYTSAILELEQGLGGWVQLQGESKKVQ